MTPGSRDLRRCCFCQLRSEAHWWAPLTSPVGVSVSFPSRRGTSICRSGSLWPEEWSDTSRWFVLLRAWRFPEVLRSTDSLDCHPSRGTIGCWWRCLEDPSCPQKLHRRTALIHRRLRIGFLVRTLRGEHQAMNLWVMKSRKLDFHENCLHQVMQNEREQREHRIIENPSEKRKSINGGKWQGDFSSLCVYLRPSAPFDVPSCECRSAARRCTFLRQPLSLFWWRWFDLQLVDRQSATTTRPTTTDSFYRLWTWNE